jgi:hypothetical protein
MRGRVEKRRCVSKRQNEGLCGLETGRPGDRKVIKSAKRQTAAAGQACCGRRTGTVARLKGQKEWNGMETAASM